MIMDEFDWERPGVADHLNDVPPAEEPEVTRRTVVKGAAWSVPVIAAAVAVPLAAASMATPEPVSCVLLNGTGSPFYSVTYTDGTTDTLHRSKVVQDAKLRELCKVPARGNEGM